MKEEEEEQEEEEQEEEEDEMVGKRPIEVKLLRHFEFDAKLFAKLFAKLHYFSE